MNSLNPTQVNVHDIPLFRLLQQKAEAMHAVRRWTLFSLSKAWSIGSLQGILLPSGPNRPRPADSDLAELDRNVSLSSQPCLSSSLHLPIKHLFLLTHVGCHGLPVSMAGQLQQLQPANQLLLSNIHPNHDQEIEPEWSPQPQASEAQSNEAAPVQQWGSFDESYSQLRLTRWHACYTVPVKAPWLAWIEVPQTSLLLSPAVSTPRLQVGGRAGQWSHWVAADVEVDLAREKPQDEVAFGLRDVLGVRHCNIMDGIQVVS